MITLLTWQIIKKGISMIGILFHLTNVEYSQKMHSRRHKMKLTTIILIISLVILSVLCTVLAYLWIDRSITLAYVNASVDSEVRTRIITTDLIESEWRGKSLNEVYQKLSTEVQKHPEQNIG